MNEDVVELDFGVRLLFIGLWTLADREGRLEYRPKRIKMQLFPADDIDITRSLTELHDSKLIELYTVKDQQLINIPHFKKNQNPHPNEAKSMLHAPGCNGLCNEGSRNDKSNPACSLLSRTSIPPPIVPPPSPDRDKGESPGNSPKGEQPRNVFLTIPLVDNTDHPITESQLEKWQAAYPAVDVGQTIQRIASWNENNPKQRKTKRGINRHIDNWLAREQDNGGQTGKASKGTGRESVSDRARRKSDELIAGLGGDQ